MNALHVLRDIMISYPKVLLILGCLALATPSAFAGGGAADGVVTAVYNEVAASVIDAATCGWSTIRGHLVGAGQSTTPVDFAESVYNANARSALIIVFYGQTTSDLVTTVDVVHGPGADRGLAFANDSYTYGKCTLAHYTTWGARTYVWYQPTVDCFYVHSDCGLENFDCNATFALDVAFGAPFILFGEPLPSSSPCAPPAGVYCICTPPENPHAFPQPPSPEEITG